MEEYLNPVQIEALRKIEDAVHLLPQKSDCSIQAPILGTSHFKAEQLIRLMLCALGGQPSHSIMPQDVLFKRRRLTSFDTGTFTTHHINTGEPFVTYYADCSSVELLDLLEVLLSITQKELAQDSTC